MHSCGHQVSFVGLTEEAAREQAAKDGYGDKVAVVKTSFKANSKACTAFLFYKLHYKPCLSPLRPNALLTRKYQDEVFFMHLWICWRCCCSACLHGCQSIS